ncbi:MAG TPA: DUF5989 family protein [Candidatus Sulfotelmatobacter sp.]|nr:DUF5989 family protein [Candidatus Sulfotelmatobacter sp.]
MLKHAWRLFADLFGFARQNKVWWIVPLVVVLILLTLFVVVGSVVAPFLYPLY